MNDGWVDILWDILSFYSLKLLSQIYLFETVPINKYLIPA